MTGKVKIILVAALSLGLVGCGQGMTAKSSGAVDQASNGGLGNGGGGGDSIGNAPVPFDAQKLSEEIEADALSVEQEAQAAADEAEAYLNRLNLGGGRIEVSGGDGGVSQQLIIDRAVKKVLDKIVEKLQKSPEGFDKLRSKVADQIAKLDSTNPLHQAAIAALMTAMSRIDELEARFGDLMGRVADAVDLVVSRLDVIVSAVPFPASILVAIEWGSVKAVLAEFQDDLRNL